MQPHIKHLLVGIFPMLRESGVKLAEEMGCRMRGMVKRKLLGSVMSHKGFMVEVTQ